MGVRESRAKEARQMADRYTKVVLTVIAVALVWLCLWGTAPKWGAPAEAAGQAKSDVPEVIRAQRFDLTDAEARVRATLALSESGTPRLRLFDEEGQVSASITLTPEGQPHLSSAQDESVSLQDVEGQDAFYWREVASWKGKGPKTTQMFTVSAPWRIEWDTQTGIAGSGVLGVFLRDEGGAMVSVLVNVMGADRDESIQHRPGTYYLEINAMQPYEIRISKRASGEPPASVPGRGNTAETTADSSPDLLARLQRELGPVEAPDPLAFEYVERSVTVTCPLCGKAWTETRRVRVGTVRASDYCAEKQCQWTKSLETQHPSWGRDVCVLIGQHKVRIGMTKEQVQESWGKPDDVSRSINRSTVYEHWRWEDYRHITRQRVMFVDGKVENIST